ncbi:hypothetical protein OOZ19_10915, partial [Saccharopolyspora sp. NFXS83]|uniref:hypothetical protein n=1 Tax=Saccharopolyspora sp. NFXS83 TaxID=2993560 RepID=UPI00224B3D84
PPRTPPTRLRPHLLPPTTNLILKRVVNEISEGQEESYFGKISSRFLKIAWAYGKDVQNHAEPKPAREKLAKKRDKPASTWDAVMHSARHLDSFIDALPGDANLADHLLGRQGKRYQDPVRSYVKALVGELLERGAAGAAPGNGGQGSLASREQAFRGQREAAMAESVRRSNGIRYVGVGNNHLEALAARLRQEPGEFHFYGLTDEGLYERPLL